MSDARIEVVGAALLDSLTSPARLLVAQRSAPAALAGRWEFPGGKRERAETPEAALHRELHEELGVCIELGDEVLAPSPGGWPLNERASMRVWCAVISEGVPVILEDHQALRWMDLQDRQAIRGLEWIEADRPIVEALLTRLAVSRSGVQR
ncbi:(deoxy)nucleoside triphosphate pyrophosphohydrolase [Psychromicrobium xiongbiense]|uniref:(deoxy)nucleoside triphosphate pyrophosphohydrolase n=1 Tax=Psychromicrobium xiongbiense TaxID=3051184 RepID=UPI003B21EEEF